MMVLGWHHRLLAATAIVLLVTALSSVQAQWVSLPGYPGGVIGSASVWTGGRLYAFGGIDQYDRYLSVARVMSAVDPVAWQALSPMPAARGTGYAAAIDGKIFVVGGAISAANNVPDVFEYDPRLDVYTSKSAIPVPVSSFAGAVVNGRIYVIGGFTAGAIRTSLVQIYDPAIDRWDTSTSLPVETAQGTATTLGDTIYLIGGSTTDGPTSHSYRGVVRTNAIEWERIADYPDPVILAASGQLRDTLYVAGGLNATAGSNGLRRVRWYNPIMNMWIPTYSLPIDCYGEHTLVNDDSTLYYPGGRKNNSVFRLAFGPPIPIANIDADKLLVSDRDGSRHRASITLRNDGGVALNGRPEVAIGAASWLSVKPDYFRIDPGDSLVLDCVFDADSLAVGDYRTELRIYTDDPGHHYFSVDARLFVRRGLVPQPYMVVLEDAAASWCWWCSYADDTLAVIKERHPGRAIVLSYHGPSSSQGSTYDSLTVPEGERLVEKLGLSAWPEAAIGRILFRDQTRRMIPMYAGRAPWAGYVDDLLREHPYAPVAMDVIDYRNLTPGGAIQARVRVVVTEPLRYDSAHRYAITAVVTQDSMNHRQVKRDPNTGQNVSLSPYYHNDVVRTIWPNAMGKELIPPNGSWVDGVIPPGTVLEQELFFNVTGVTKPDLGSVTFLLHKYDSLTPGVIIQGWRQAISSLSLALRSDESEQTIPLDGTARFRSVLTNRAQRPRRITVMRTEQSFPDSSWFGAVSIDGNPYPPSRDTVSFTLEAGDSAVIGLNVVGGSIGQGYVGLHIVNDIGECFDPLFTITTSHGSEAPIVTGQAKLTLDESAPNPTEGIATIRYCLARPGHITLDLFSLDGRWIATIVDNEETEGAHSAPIDLSHLDAGIYLMQLRSAGEMTTRRIILSR